MKTLQEFKKSEKALNKEIKEYYEKQYSGEYVSLDGIVDINQYYNCAERILWVMKEPNGMKGIDMREYLKDNNEYKNPETFNPILYITYGILNM